MSIDPAKILRLRSQAAAMRVLAEEAPTDVGRETMRRLAQKLDNLANRTAEDVPFVPMPEQARYLN